MLPPPKILWLSQQSHLRVAGELLAKPQSQFAKLGRAGFEKFRVAPLLSHFPQTISGPRQVVDRKSATTGPPILIEYTLNMD